MRVRRLDWFIGALLEAACGSRINSLLLLPDPYMKLAISICGRESSVDVATLRQLMCLYLCVVA
jgi:hypothetical protein